MTLRCPRDCQRILRHSPHIWSLLRNKSKHKIVSLCEKLVHQSTTNTVQGDNQVPGPSSSLHHLQSWDHQITCGGERTGSQLWGRRLYGL
jgi:hypothetical protein